MDTVCKDVNLATLERSLLNRLFHKLYLNSLLTHFNFYIFPLLTHFQWVLIYQAPLTPCLLYPIFNFLLYSLSMVIILFNNIFKVMIKNIINQKLYLKSTWMYLHKYLPFSGKYKYKYKYFGFSNGKYKYKYKYSEFCT